MFIGKETAMLSKKLKVVAIFVAVLTIGYIFSQPKFKSEVESLDLAFGAIAQSSGENSEDPVSTAEVIEMVLGSENAPLTVIEYASFTCPHCASFHEGAFKDLKKAYIDTGKIKFIFREVYFDKYGVWASLVARCAGPEKFFGITDFLLSSQPKWARADSDLQSANELRKLARLVGMAEDNVERCLSDEKKIKALVAWYRENATKDKIQSTPSFIIDGELYKNMDYEKFAEILDKKLGF